MTVTDSPQVSPVAPEQAGLVVDKLNTWRDDMATVNLEAVQDKQPQVFAATLDGRVVGGYVMIQIPMANEIVLLAINPEYRRRGLGRMCCMDALFRSGKRPLVLTANDASVDFAKTVGFKIVGKRKQPDGTMLTRLGWHAPRPKTDPNAPPGC
jgi:ribosomal protein S18 acetylase RimI-like enzyme